MNPRIVAIITALVLIVAAAGTTLAGKSNSQSATSVYVAADYECLTTKNGREYIPDLQDSNLTTTIVAILQGDDVNEGLLRWELYDGNNGLIYWGYFRLIAYCGVYTVTYMDIISGFDGSGDAEADQATLLANPGSYTLKVFWGDPPVKSFSGDGFTVAPTTG